MSNVVPNIEIPHHVLANIISHQDFVNQKLGRLVADSTSVGTILGNFLAARTKDFTDQDIELQTDAEESIAGCAVVTSDQQKDFKYFIEQLEMCSWKESDSSKKNSVQSIDITSLDPKRIVDKEVENSLRLDYYLLAKLANEGLEDDISLPVKDAFSHLAVKNTQPVTVQFMIGVLDFDISANPGDGKVILDFVYFTYELSGVLDLYGTETCNLGSVRTVHKHMSFDWKAYKDGGMKGWAQEIFYTDDVPRQPNEKRKAYIQELLLHNNIVSLTDDVTNWVGAYVEDTTVKVIKNADYQNSAFNMVLFRCIQVVGSLKRHGTGKEEHLLQTLDITAFLQVPLWGRVWLGTGSTVFQESLDFDGKSNPWTQTFSIPGVAVCTLTFDIEDDPQLWCTAQLDGPLTGLLNTKVHILNVEF